MAEKHGSLSINSDNIFPVIKKWLYSDHDIFYRELVSNGCDVITKLKKLDMMGEYDLPADYKPQIEIEVNPDAKTLTVTDNGLGMTADEVEEYINQIAFPAPTIFWKNTKTKPTTTRSSAISDWDFILRSWLRMKCTLIRFPIRTAQPPYTGSATAARNFP